MMQETGCDAVMIGRAALGQPWIFRHILHYLNTGQTLPSPSRTERATLALEHARRTLATSKLDEKQAVLELRGQISKYNLDEPGSVMMRNQIVRASSLEEIESILTPLLQT